MILPCALRSFREIEERLHSSPRLFLGLDFDGVLAPIVGRIPQAKISAAARRPLSRLLKAEAVSVAVITGRSLKDAKRKVPFKGLSYSGNHGLEIESGRWRFEHPAAEKARPRLDALAAELEAALAEVPGIEIERKVKSVSVHTRRTPPRLLSRANGICALTLKFGAKGLKIIRGKNVWEIKPGVNWDKGDALRELQKRLGGRPLFIGDDTVDEPAFLEAQRLGGIGIRVRPNGATAARYALASQKSVSRFLEKIASGYCRR